MAELNGEKVGTHEIEALRPFARARTPKDENNLEGQKVRVAQARRGRLCTGLPVHRQDRTPDLGMRSADRPIGNSPSRSRSLRTEGLERSGSLPAGSRSHCFCWTRRCSRHCSERRAREVGCDLRETGSLKLRKMRTGGRVRLEINTQRKRTSVVNGFRDSGRRCNGVARRTRPERLLKLFLGNGRASRRRPCGKQNQ